MRSYESSLQSAGLDVTNFSSTSFVKICGLTTPDDIAVSVRAGADALGLILASSPRQISVEAAQTLAALAKDHIPIWAVFRDQADEWILNAIDKIEPDAVQLHGKLSDVLLNGARARATQVVKALAIGSDDFLTFDESKVDAVLIDGHQPGSGIVHSWDALFERPFAVPVIAAGGLNPDNVAIEIVRSRAWGVDTASGVESAPGVKDHTLVMHFVENARRAFEEREGR